MVHSYGQHAKDCALAVLCLRTHQSQHISPLSSRLNEKVSKATAGVFEMRGRMGPVPYNKQRLNCASCHGNSFLLP